MYTVASFCGAGGLPPPEFHILDVPAIPLQVDVPFTAFVCVGLDGVAFVAPVNRYGVFAIKSDFHFGVVLNVPFHFFSPPCFPFLLIIVPQTYTYSKTEYSTNMDTYFCWFCMCTFLLKCGIFKRGDKMYSEASYRASKKYRAANIKRVPLDMQIADYEKVKAHATARGESVNGFIKRAIQEAMNGGKDESSQIV